ncbi:MAG: flagellar hook-associated protein FlgL [Firmicutes bacterium]|nr:flagellar hook-associated protein FlgL [Bacillota bacterium]
MRITNNMMISHMMRNYMSISINMDKTLNQVSTGEMYRVPSDNPVKMSQSLRMRTDLFEIDQYRKNVSDAKSWMEASESSMQSAEDILNRIRELTVYAYNGTIPKDSRTSIATEIEMLTQELKNIGNTNIAGRYIFNGQLTTEVPYHDGDDGYIEFRGDTGAGQRLYEIGQGVTLQVNVPPGKLYDNGRMDILAELRNLCDDLKQPDPMDFDSVVDCGTVDISAVTLGSDLDFDVFMAGITTAVNVPAGAYTGDELVDNINAQLEAGGIKNMHFELSPGNRLVVKANAEIDPNSVYLVDNSAGPDTLTGSLGLNMRRSVLDPLGGPPNDTKIYQVNNYEGVVGIGNIDISSVTINAGEELSFQIQVQDKAATVTLGPGVYTGQDIIDTINTQLTAAGITNFRTTLTQSNRLMMVADPDIDKSSITLKDFSTGITLKNTLGREEGIALGYMSDMTNINYTLARGSKNISSVVLKNDLVWEVQENTRNYSHTATITLSAVDGLGNPIVYSGPEIIDEVNRQLAAAGISNVSAYLTPTNRITFVSGADINPSDFSIVDKSTGGTDTLESVTGLRSGKMMGYLQKIDAGIDNVLNWRSELGSRVNRLEMADARMQDTSLYITQVRSEMVDVDFAEMATQLKMQENLQRAALAVGARIIQPTLIDFLG